MTEAPAPAHTLDQALADAAREVDALLNRTAPPAPATSGAARRIATITSRQEQNANARRPA